MTIQEAWGMIIMPKEVKTMMGGSCGRRATLSNRAWKCRKWENDILSFVTLCHGLQHWFLYSVNADTGIPY